ncbi:MAG TPA: aminotransferase class I/II-fold pyridoxal phosphate-dependent enzyme [Gaiellaceae bacterium]|nr:aminotransferase class I/II-fold pyridoxal phosphate-dependent enzyme [Gaiellaceae bacterium]
MTETATEFQPFQMERWQSLWEHDVEYNLADSAVRCAPLGLLLDGDELQQLASLELFYPEVNGTELLRERIAATYAPEPRTDEILVTVGASEANALVCQTLLEHGDRVTVIEPGYRQVRGIAENLGCAVDVVQLNAEDGWELDIAALRAAIGPQTKLVCVVNPNNPTGTVLTGDARAALLEAVEASGAWLLADEVYRGSEHDGVETESFWASHPRAIVVNSLSKAYGLCGLRIGWVAAPQPLLDDLWRRHEYAVISASLPSVFLAERALAKRSELLARQRGLVRDGKELYARWLADHAAHVSAQATTATALSFPHIELPLPSAQVADEIRTRGSVLVIPGSMMGSEGHVRLTVGFEPEFLGPALDRIAAVLDELA